MKSNYKQNISIIELLTVILVILLLISLIVPIFITLKMNARSAICKGQLRQLGVMINSYVSSYNGYLPNDNAGGRDGRGGAYPSDCGQGLQKYENNELYKYWNGHLLPFFNTPLKNWVRAAKVSIDGEVRWQEEANPFDETARIDQPNDPLINGWAVVDDAYRKGGYSDLRAFICPEIHNTYDIAAHNATNGRIFPRIKLSDPNGFPRNVGDYLGDGTPTTYLANDYFFGQDAFYDKCDSLRVDEIADISSKAFLIEGGLCYGSGRANTVYYDSGFYAREDAPESDFFVNAYGNRFNRVGLGTKTSFVHDRHEEVWLSLAPGQMAFYCDRDIIAEFNKFFEGKAYFVPNAPNQGWGYFIISYLDPDGGVIQDWLNKKQNAEPEKFPSAIKWPGTNMPLKFVLYEPENSYLTGNMNILFGDNSVATKDQGWLYNNREKVALKTKE